MKQMQIENEIFIKMCINYATRYDVWNRQVKHRLSEIESKMF